MSASTLFLAAADITGPRSEEGSVPGPTRRRDAAATKWDSLEPQWAGRQAGRTVTSNRYQCVRDSRVHADTHRKADSGGTVPQVPIHTGTYALKFISAFTGLCAS